MQPTTVQSPRPATSGGPGLVVAVPGDGQLPQGAAHWSQVFYNAAGTVEAARRMPLTGRRVPVDGHGRLVAAQYECPRCREQRWLPVPVKQPPLCLRDRVSFREARPVSALSWLLPPPAEVWALVSRPLRPVLAGAGVGVAGVFAAAAEVPAVAPLALAPVAGVAVARWGRRRLRGLAAGWGEPDPGAAADRWAPVTGVCTAAVCGWTALAATAGVDPTSVGGAVSWTALAALWLPAAATWWRYLRRRNARVAPAPVVEGTPVDEGPPVDPTEAEVRRIWATVVARRPQATAPGQPAPKPGKLAGTWLEDWHTVDGGWAATICSQPGDYTAETFLGSRGAIASAYRMKAHMVTLIPDVADETQALVLCQRSSPIAETVYWAGPSSVNGATGRAVIAQYADGSPAEYELYRPEWGCPHDFLCGTTGAGKSETLSTLLLIDRWAHYRDEAGQAHGMVADILIDPQQGQSYGPFLDDLAAPVATSLEEALMVVEAFRQEMLRRNRFLAAVQWPDPRRRARDGSPVMRRGRKWWNPLIDGPQLTLNIDEAHEFLSDKRFAALVTAGARMYRKCGMRVRVATHTPLLADLGGSMALRSMLTGGFVWVGRTADSLSGPIAFNGRLPVDPKTIPDVPGLGYVLSKLAPKPMLARVGWLPDYYDAIRDDDDRPIGFPAVLPEVTLAAFGPEWASWVQASRTDGEVWAPTPSAPQPEPVNPRSVDAVLAVLDAADGPVDIDELDAGLQAAGTPFSTRTIRDALKKLDGRVVKDRDRRYALTVEARVAAADELAVASEQATLLAAELAEDGMS